MREALHPYPDMRDVYPALLDAVDPLGVAYLHLIQGPDEESRSTWPSVVDGADRQPRRPPARRPLRRPRLRSGRRRLGRRHGTGQLRPAPPPPPGAPLNEPDPTTFHGGDHCGYTDYLLPITTTTAS